MIKVCRVCKKELPLECFSKDKNKKDGHSNRCKACDAEYKKQQKKCFNYKNCQPLWEKDNYKKSDFLPDGTRGRDIKGELK